MLARLSSMVATGFFVGREHGRSDPHAFSAPAAAHGHDFTLGGVGLAGE